MNGHVVHFNQKGFGFIYSDELKRRVFFHVSTLIGAETPEINQAVTFDLTPAGKPGQPDKAVNVKVVESTVTAGIDALKAAKIENIAGVDVLRTLEGV